ncbi:MAG: SRPBCC domain-containing protein [Rhizobiales bacterium]|nr:SRPBCC domain-containing protein [Hyphomicrobiales bacterium]
MSKEFTISRTVNAPRDLVWKAWSERDAFGQWWGPKGCKLDVTKFEFRPGGMFHYGMKLPDGNVWWGRFVYREIVKPERIVFVNSFSDANGGVTRAPFSATWPLEILNNLTLTESGGKTTLDLSGGPVNPSDEERAMFESMFGSMTQGFGGTLDQLEEFLAKA